MSERDVSDAQETRESIVRWGRSLFERGLTPGSSGNISVRLDDGYLMTPTNSCLGFLDASRLARLDREGHRLSGDAPTKELPLHFAYYQSRPTARAGGRAFAFDLRNGSFLPRRHRPRDAISPITPYVVMKSAVCPSCPIPSQVRPLLRRLLAPALPTTRRSCWPITAPSSQQVRSRPQCSKSRKSRRRRSSSF